MPSLQLAPIGNCTTAALVDRTARISWYCLPYFDGDPVFFRLLDGGEVPPEEERGLFAIDLVDPLEQDGHPAPGEQDYLRNSAVLRTVLRDRHGGAVEIIDFAPRFRHLGRTFRPQMLVRIVRPLVGRPRVRIRLRPAFSWGQARPHITRGSNHVRYVGPDQTLRLTSDVAPSLVLDETPFLLEQPVHLVLSDDESLDRAPAAVADRFLAETLDYWRQWVRGLAVPYEWQDAVIRAAITLHLCLFEDTGGIVAAMTTSIPEAAHTPRTWDYRYCWLRDAYFVVRALNRLGAVEIMEDYLRYLRNIVATAGGGHLQPVYDIGQQAELPERTVDLAGYRGMGPVRVGNQAWEHVQNDVYGEVVLATTQAFFDARLLRPGTIDDFHLLEGVGEQAWRLHDQPDAGLWEYRSIARVHTSSSFMCFAACDRLARIATRLGLDESAGHWYRRAEHIRQAVLTRAWSEERRSFTGSFGGTELDASLLLMPEVGLVDWRDPRFVATVERIGEELVRGGHLMRYVVEDDFGSPESAFTVCSFWYVDALARLGRKDEAREMFQRLLAHRNHVGLLSEDVHVGTGELWGNFPQTYSLVGLISSALALSEAWENVL